MSTGVFLTNSRTYLLHIEHIEPSSVAFFNCDTHLLRVSPQRLAVVIGLGGSMQWTIISTDKSQCDSLLLLSPLPLPRSALLSAAPPRRPLSLLCIAGTLSVLTRIVVHPAQVQTVCNYGTGKYNPIHHPLLFTEMMARRTQTWTQVYPGLGNVGIPHLCISDPISFFGVANLLHDAFSFVDCSVSD